MIDVTVDEFMPALRRRMVWDIVPDDRVREWSDELGLNGTSPDVDELERQGAARRRQGLSPIAPWIYLSIGMAGDIIETAVILQAEEAAEEAGEEGDVIMTQVDTTKIVYSAVLAVLANLVDIGVLRLGKALT